MKQKILFSLVMAASITGYAQSDKKLTGYAITGDQNGFMNWKTVKLINLVTGEEIKTLYANGQQEPELLNARTGKPIVKKETEDAAKRNETVNIKVVLHGKQPGDASAVYTFNSIEELKASKAFKEIAVPAPPTPPTAPTPPTPPTPSVDVIMKDLNMKIRIERDNNITRSITINRNINSDDRDQNRRYVVRNYFSRGFESINTDEPFATGSTAMAYDKKHERLYYTPMGISQLRYIDLKSKTPKIYYFEDEVFGVATGSRDEGNQITRMVIASDGNGYALTNNNEHLLRFTTGKNPVITDMGALTDDAVNGELTILSNRRGFGGDLVADASENLYLINQGRKVFKISTETKVATYLGTIEGLPYGYTTNGAMVEEAGKVIVGSSNSDEGYYRVDMKTLQAEKVSTRGAVFKVADLASGNLLFEKEEKKEEIMPVLAYQAKAIPTEATNGISVYPNPVFDGTVKLSFANQPAGEYQVSLMELSGKVVSVRNVTINSKVQQVQFSLPQSMAKGSYLVKTVSDVNKISVISKLVVE